VTTAIAEFVSPPITQAARTNTNTATNRLGRKDVILRFFMFWRVWLNYSTIPAWQ
jgi:hypothetical protein